MSVSITKKPLLPKITIKKDDATTYTFDYFASTFDFRLRGLQFNPAYDSTGGKFTLQITSSDGTNSGTNTLLDNITGGNEVTIWLGKDSAGYTKLFLGIIENIQIQEPNKNFIDLTVSGPDWGSSILKNRVVIGEWLQKYEADGVTLDATDTTTLISQITTDLLTETEHYPTADITVEDQGIIVTAANITPIDIPLAQFTVSYEKLDDKLADLDKVGASIHYVDPDKNFIMKQANSSTPTGLLLVDDYNDATAVAWDQTKVGLIGVNSTTTLGLETHKRRLFGIGGDQTDQIDQSSTTDAGTPSTLYDKYVAQRFTPIINNVYDIAVKLSKVGTPTLDVTLELIEDNDSNEPKGTVLRTIDLNKNALSTTASWHLFKMSEKLNTSKNYWIVIRRNSSDDASNTVRWHHDNVDNNPSESSTSTDGITWTLTTTPNRFKYAFRQYYSTPLLAVANTVGLSSTSKHFYEEAIKEPDVTKKQLLDQILTTESETAFKQKMTFNGMIYSPDTLIQAGDKIRIRKNTSGYTYDHDDFVVGSVTYIFQSSDDLATGTFWYEIVASRFIDFA